jgi:hypothetical protein
MISFELSGTLCRANRVFANETISFVESFSGWFHPYFHAGARKGFERKPGLEGFFGKEIVSFANTPIYDLIECN